MKKIIKSAILASSLLLTQAVAQENQEKKGFFATASLGYTSTTISQNDKGDSIVLTKDAQDDSGVNYTVGVGYRYNQNIFTTVEYSKISFDMAKLDAIVVGMNYQFDTTLNPYVGVSVGQSKLKWKESPIEQTEEIVSDKSTKNTYGLQVGCNYDISKSIELFGQYQVLFQEHKTTITSPVHDTEVIGENQNNLNIGIRYYF